MNSFTYPPPPPLEKNHTAVKENYDRLLSGCMLLCRNYRRLLCTYNNLLEKYQYMLIHNKCIIEQFSSLFKQTHKKPFLYRSYTDEFGEIRIGRIK